MATDPDSLASATALASSGVTFINNNVRELLLKTAERFDKCPELKYAAANARILAEPGQYSAAEIQACPDIELTMVEREEEPNNIVAWHEMGEQLDREIYYDSVTNEVEDEDYEVIGMRMAPDNEHRDYWIKFHF
jgi:hypothetical protein